MGENSYDIGKAFGYMTAKEIGLLKRTAKKLYSNPIVVNIGAGAGTSSLAIAEERADAFIYTIDINQDGPFGSLQGELNAFEKAGLHPPTQFLGDSGVVSRTFDDEVLFGWPIDLIVVDDGHDEYDVRRDILCWIPMLRKSGGYMAFHDYGSEEWPDVKKVVDDLLGYEHRAIADTMLVLTWPFVKETK